MADNQSIIPKDAAPSSRPSKTCKLTQTAPAPPSPPVAMNGISTSTSNEVLPPTSVSPRPCDGGGTREGVVPFMKDKLILPDTNTLRVPNSLQNAHLLCFAAVCTMSKVLQAVQAANGRFGRIMCSNGQMLPLDPNADIFRCTSVTGPDRGQVVVAKRSYDAFLADLRRQRSIFAGDKSKRDMFDRLWG